MWQSYQCYTISIGTARKLPWKSYLIYNLLQDWPMVRLVIGKLLTSHLHNFTKHLTALIAQCSIALKAHDATAKVDSL